MVLAAILVAAVVAGCAGPGKGVAERIRAANSPIVREVYVSPANPFGGKQDEVQVFVVDGATQAEKLSVNGRSRARFRLAASRLGRHRPGRPTMDLTTGLWDDFE
jgi:hypothetical protein